MMPDTDDSAALIAEIAEWIDPHRNPDNGTVWYSCPQCDCMWEKDAPQKHQDDCVVGRARAIVARQVRA